MIRTRSPRQPGKPPAGQRWACHSYAPVPGLRDEAGHAVIGWNWELESTKAPPPDPVAESPAPTNRGLARREAVQQRELDF